MTLFEFAFKNIIRDRRNYIYYFINCAFSVFVFFLFSILSFHPALSIIDSSSTMSIILAVGQLISILFSVCFIFYSVKCFLKARSKQFGIITILGASKKQINSIVFTENIIVGFMSIITGMVFGMVFSKLFLDIANKMISVSDFVFYFPLKAIIFTFFIMFILFFIIAYFTPLLISKQSIVNLFKSSQKDEKKQNLIPIIILFFICLIIILYAFFVKTNMAKSLQENFLFPFVVILFVICGTYLFFVVFIYFYILFEQKSSYKMRLISVGDKRAKFRTNVKGMTISAILYTTAFFSVTVLFSLSYNVKLSTQKVLPYAMHYNAWNSNIDTEKHMNIIEYELDKISKYKKVDINLWYLNDDFRTAVMSESDYNNVMNFFNRWKIKLNNEQVYLVAGNSDVDINKIDFDLKDYIGNVKIKDKTNKIITITGFVKYICVVDDDLFKNLRQKLLFKRTITAFDFDDWENKGEIVDVIDKKLKTDLENRNINVTYAYRYYRSSQIQNNLSLYIGCMLAFVFILAVASFVYSRLYSEIDMQCKKFKAIIKIGLSKKELEIILKRHIFLILYIPFIIALIYVWIGIFILERFIFVSNIPVAISFTILLIVLQTILYFCVKTLYKRRIFEKIYC